MAVKVLKVRILKFWWEREGSVKEDLDQGLKARRTESMGQEARRGGW